MFANMQNYQIYKFCECIFAYLQVNAHAQFACFIVACITKLLNYKHINF
jgi:hypothetical protein